MEHVSLVYNEFTTYSFSTRIFKYICTSFKNGYFYMVRQMVTYQNVTSTNPTCHCNVKIFRNFIFIVKSLKNE